MTLLARVDGDCAARGHPRPPHVAPMEHLERLPPDTLPSAAHVASRDVVSCYHQERFGGREADPSEVARLGSALTSALASAGTPGPPLDDGSRHGT